MLKVVKLRGSLPGLCECFVRIFLREQLKRGRLNEAISSVVSVIVLFCTLS